jgi:hypothetical protein
MGVIPRIADVQCSRLVFQPGDRIIVKSPYRIDEEQKRHLRKSLRKFAGCDVEIFIYCTLDFELQVEHGNTI